MQKNYDFSFKIVIIGSSSVGKSSILRRFADDEFEQNYISTIGIDFRFKSMYINDNFVKLQIWDTAGQQRFRGITKSYYKGAQAVILVYDINNQKTFEDMVAFWIKETKQYVQADRVFCFINKCDKGEQTVIPEAQIQFLKENNVEYFKVSAKKKYNVSQSIQHISELLTTLQPKIVQNNKNNMTLNQTHQRASKQRKCCK